ncbi:MAG TPA: glucose 1-dehydrogenase [Bradyrhizobium sp.]|nr:glucose 1-dehydrogenase [Bradyrhizobium sp.]
MATETIASEFNRDLPDYKTCPKLLIGQKAVVTGSSAGIGKAVAEGLARAGAEVVINYAHDAAGAQAAAKAIENEGGKAIIIQADVSKPDEVKSLFKQTLQAFGTIDILVANSGIQRDAQAIDMTLEQWNEVLSVNLTGQFLCIQEAVREFLRRGVRKEISVAAGKIICMSSVHEVIPWGGHVNYATSKGGIQMMMKSLAQELAPHRIRVNAIGPGAIRTHINTDAWKTTQAYVDLMKLVPYKRIGEPEDIAQAAIYLASDMADYVTGTTLFVDGGMTCYPGFEAGG